MSDPQKSIRKIGTLWFRLKEIVARRPPEEIRRQRQDNPLSQLDLSVHGQSEEVRRRRQGRALSQLDLSVHMVLTHAHVSMALWSLSSFLYFSGLTPSITIHDDGSLTDDDQGLLRAHVPRCKILSRAQTDGEMNDWLKTWPRTRAMRRIEQFYCARKLLDAWVYADGDTVLLLDSDVLFFNKPSELLRCAKEGVACFNSDYQNAYAHDIEVLSEWMGREMTAHVNAGLLVMHRRWFDMELIEDYFTQLPLKRKNPNSHEQTLYAMFMTRAEAQRLSPSYQISKTLLTGETVAHHYVSDGSRPCFWTTGVAELQKCVAFEDLHEFRAMKN